MIIVDSPGYIEYPVQIKFRNFEYIVPISKLKLDRRLGGGGSGGLGTAGRNAGH